MRELGMNARVRGRRTRATVPGLKAPRAPDLLKRDFTAKAPNRA